MQRDGDRDRAVDRALRQTLRASASEPQGGHVDGETLAAWTEGQLRSTEGARVEQHLADCARCQQLLATFARTSPPHVVSEPLWRRWRLQWLVPIATAATVAALWVAAPKQPSRVQQPIADQTTPAPPAAENEATRSTATPQAPSIARQEAQPAAEPPAAKAADTKALAAPAAPAAPAPSAAEKREDAESVRREALGAVSAPQAGPIAAPEADAKQRDEQPGGRLAETVQVTPETPAAQARAIAPTASATPTAAARTGNAARTFGTSAFSPQPDIVSPNAAMRWRIVGGNRIERSTNGGREWQTATVPSPGVFTAGMSPSPSICWIVGREGVVYVTTDGLRFTRVKFPESIALVSVTATDERHATVMSADGRSFRTDDQGGSWAP